jgi:hypothetical protein
MVASNMVQEAPLSIFCCAKVHGFFTIIAITELPSVFFWHSLHHHWYLNFVFSPLAFLRQPLHWSQMGEDTCPCTSTFHCPRATRSLLICCPIRRRPLPSRPTPGVIVVINQFFGKYRVEVLLLSRSIFLECIVYQPAVHNNHCNWVVDGNTPNLCVE